MEHDNNELFLKQLINKHKDNVMQYNELEMNKRKYKYTSSKLDDIIENLRLNIMVPVPSNESTPLAFIEGSAVHTNELLVMLGSNYYCDMTAKDAIKYLQRKCEDINNKQNALLKERKLLQERLTWLEYENKTEIVEHYNEEMEILWRERHKEYMRKMKKQEAEERKNIITEKPDYYFSRLDELELEEQSLEE